MCLIVYQPAKCESVLTKEEFANLGNKNKVGRYVPNPDWKPGNIWTSREIYKQELGPLGIMWPTGKRVATFKVTGGSGHDEVYDKYTRLAGKRPVIMHFRTHTDSHGTRNVQPFSAGDVGFALNGSVSLDGPSFGEYSDAWCFAKYFLPIFGESIFSTRKAIHAIKMLSNDSILAFMDKRGKVKLIEGEYHDSKWIGGRWYSHDDWRGW